MSDDPFRPRKYDVTKDQLDAWRNAGESTVTIGNRFTPPASPKTVRDWLIAFGLPTVLKAKPSDEPPGKHPRTKRIVYEAEREARRMNEHNEQSVSGEKSRAVA